MQLHSALRCAACHSSLPQVRFIGSNHVTSHELLSFNVVWLGLQAWELLMWLKARTTTAQFARAIGTTIITAVGAVVGGVVLLTLTGACGKPINLLGRIGLGSVLLCCSCLGSLSVLKAPGWAAVCTV